MRSPLRYPGGKSRLTKTILPYLPEGSGFCEPFMGGGSVLLAYSEAHPDATLWANDLDPNVAAFWKVLIGTQKSFDSLCTLIEEASVTAEEFRRIQSSSPRSNVDRAFRVLFLSKTAFSGIQTASPIGGWNQTGDWKIDCQYNAKNILKNCQAARAVLKGRLRITSLHFRDVLNQSKDVMYLDPPYFQQAKNTYPHMMADVEHEELSGLLRARKEPWALSYKDCPGVRALYSGLTTHSLAHRHSMTSAYRSGGDWKDGQEILITNRGD